MTISKSKKLATTPTNSYTHKHTHIPLPLYSSILLMAPASFLVFRLKTTANLYTASLISLEMQYTNYSLVFHSLIDSASSGPLFLFYCFNSSYNCGKIHLSNRRFLNHRLNHFTLITHKSTNDCLSVTKWSIQKPPQNAPIYLWGREVQNLEKDKQEKEA